MEAIYRATALFLFLLLIFRVTGKRTLAEITTFDFVLLLIISETTQGALIGEDYSVTQAALAITTLIFLNISISHLKSAFPMLDRILEDLPLIIMKDGKPIENRMKKERIDKSDILAAAREKMGLESLDQIKYAILESNGGISIVPKESAK